MDEKKHKHKERQPQVHLNDSGGSEQQSLNEHDCGRLPERQEHEHEANRKREQHEGKREREHKHDDGTSLVYPCGKTIQRRDFLKAAWSVAAAIPALSALTSCGQSQKINRELTAANPAQKKRKKTGSSSVALIQTESYSDNLLSLIKPYIKDLGLPDLSNKIVVIKPNMVEFRPGKPITTNPKVIKAAVELVDYLGAREIIIGEGPGHMRDTEFLLDATGIGDICSKLGVQFVDLNLDNLEKVPNPDNFSGLDYFFLPRTVVDADAVISLPKMKTHHWVGMTASMKNLFGTVPGRKYGWPKNLLHIKGIPHCILDLVNIVHPRFALIDAITAMEGDGPINGIAKHTGFLAIGTDLAAVDATCCRTMSIQPELLPYIRMAGEVVGNINAQDINVLGSTIASLQQKFQRPITFNNEALLAQAGQQGS